LGNYSKGLESLVETTRTVVISGYYGFGNSGDEAVLQAIVLALRGQADAGGQAVRIIVLSANPEHTQKQYQVEAVNRMSLVQIWKAIRAADALISGGGSLLQDVTGWKTVPYYLFILKLAQWLKKPTFIYAQGVGPIRRRRFDSWISSVFQRTAGITVRDPESVTYLQSIGVPAEKITQVPDPVMGLFSERTETRPPRAGVEEVIGLAVRSWQPTQRELREIGRALALVAQDRQVRIKVLPFHQPADVAASYSVIEAMIEAGGAGVPIEWMNELHDPLKMMDAVQSCDVLIGMRLHALIYAATRFVPCVAISYDPKIDQFMHQIAEQVVGNTQTVIAEQIAEHTNSLLDQGPFWLMERREQIVELQHRAHLPAKMIFETLNDMHKVGE
jgi:polysaccharide pyruvyl transferase CsaB